MDANEDATRPDWWEENEQLKQAYELPSYDAPRFQDGPYIHEAVSDLEEELDVRIRLVNSEPVENGRWEVSIDGERVEKFGRYRDEDANSVFKIHSETFRELVRETVQE